MRTTFVKRIWCNCYFINSIKSNLTPARYTLCLLCSNRDKTARLTTTPVQAQWREIKENWYLSFSLCHEQILCWFDHHYRWQVMLGLGRGWGCKLHSPLPPSAGEGWAGMINPESSLSWNGPDKFHFGNTLQSKNILPPWLKKLSTESSRPLLNIHWSLPSLYMEPNNLCSAVLRYTFLQLK